MGGDLGGTGGTVPQKHFRWRTAHVSVSPNISRSSIIGCVRNYELSKKGVIKEFILRNSGFSRQERTIYVIYNI